MNTKVPKQTTAKLLPMITYDNTSTLKLVPIIPMRKNEGGKKITGGRPDKTQIIYRARSGYIQHGFSQTRIMQYCM